MKTIKLVLTTALCLSSLALTTACNKPKAEPAKEDAAGAKDAQGTKAVGADAAADPSFNKLELASFAALPARMDEDGTAPSKEKIDLGRMLYFEKRLSKNQDLSCNSCHGLSEFGIDTRGDRKTSLGHKGQLGGRNAPTVYNAALHIAQFWDGRAPKVEDQAKGPPLNPIEMAMPNEAAIVKVLESMPAYTEAFKAAFPEDKQPVSFDNMAKAIGAFERGLVTPSPFDAFLGGKTDALSLEARRGLKTFLALGCTSCHNGVALGGNAFQKLGAVEPWPNQADQGRFAETKAEADKMIFKVPSLRNIAKTGPYSHDGSIDSLETMVKMMARYQLGKKELTDAETKDLLSFLDALTGEPTPAYIAEPTLPPSSESTPKPDPS